MIHIRLLVLLLIGVTAISCKKRDATDDDNAAAPIVEAKRGDDLALLPVDTELVFGVRFAKIRQTALWKQLVEPLIDRDELHAFKTLCGFDPISAITNISIGMRKVESDHPFALIVLHGLDRKKVMKCLDSIVEAGGKDAEDITRDGDITLIKVDADEPVAFSFVNPNTALMVVGSSSPKRDLAPAPAGSSTLKASGAFTAILDKIPPNDSVWFVVNGNSSVFSELDVKPTAVFGAVDVGDGVAADIRIRLATADQATALATEVKAATSEVTPFVDKLDVAASGTEIKIIAAMSGQKLQTAIKQFGPLLLESADSKQ